MSLEIKTVGAKVLYCWETTAGTRPTSGYTLLKGVNEAPEFAMTPNNIDCSDITDEYTRYTEGRQDLGSDAVFTLNHRDDVITQWDALVSAVGTNRADGKKLWFEYWFPNAQKGFFWAGYPTKLGTSGITQNELDTIPAHVVPNGYAGWQAIVGEAGVITLSKTSMYISTSSTDTATATGYTGTLTATSSDTSIATVAVSSSTITVTAVSSGTCTITVSDSNGATATISVVIIA